MLGHGTGRAGFTAFRYRPSFPDMLNETFASVAPGSTVGIGSCGPVSLTTDVRRAVGAYQWQLAKGHVGETVGAAEVELVTEVFGAWPDRLCNDEAAADALRSPLSRLVKVGWPEPHLRLVYRSRVHCLLSHAHLSLA